MLNLFNNNESYYFKKSITGGREVNQDECIFLNIGNNIVFLAVADGMGGIANGNIASNIAINIACDKIESEFQNKEITSEQLKAFLMSIFKTIQAVIREQICKVPRLTGMGTTLTALLIYKDKYVWGNIGDSRIFKIKKRKLIQLTEDHNYISIYKKENGGIIPMGVKEKYGHLLTKCLDGGDDEPDIYPIHKDYEQLDDELFLLCSDGLLIEDTKLKISKSFLGRMNLIKTGERMIARAIESGSTDNITIILYNAKRK